jgi:glycosyltransferase involved in cell wall biosynthesis
MRILHCTLSFVPGGRRRAIATLCERLRDLQGACDLCCLNDLGCPTAEVEDLFGSVTALGRRSVLDPGAIRRLIDLCDERRIEVLHAHDGASQFTGALLRLWRPRIKMVMTFHRTRGFESARFRDRARNAWAGAHTAAVITGSRERREHFLHENYIPSRKVVLIPFGVDIERFRPEPAARDWLRQQLGVSSETIVLGAIGHFGPEKGIDCVLEGFASLADRSLPCPTALVVLGAGTPEQQEALEKQARQQGVGRVIFVGYRTDAERWLRGMDVFVHAPRAEAFGLVVAEAMASGVPVIATAVGGVVDMVRPGRTGFLVPAEAPRELAEALHRLIVDPGLRQAFGDAARETARAEYGADLYARRHLQLYADLLANLRPKGVILPVHEPLEPSSTVNRAVLESV